MVLSREGGCFRILRPWILSVSGPGVLGGGDTSNLVTFSRPSCGKHSVKVLGG